MKKLVLSLIMVAVTTAAFAAPSVLRKSGDCKLQVADAFDDAKVTKVTVSNADLEVVCKMRGEDDFLGAFVVIANPALTNKSKKKLDVAYHVGFFDKEGQLVATATQSGDIDNDADGYQFGSCIANVPKGEFAKIVSYKIVIYASESKSK